MASFNQVILLGNLTRDPQLRYLNNQTPVVEFGMATNRKHGEKEEVCFVDCSAFGKQAEVIQQYAQKGKSLLVQGRLRYETWDDKNGGGKRSKLSVTVENFQFVGGRDGGGSDAAPQSKIAPRPTSKAYQNAKKQQDDSDLVPF